MKPASEVARLRHALPFWLSILTVPLAIAGAAWGGLWTLALPIFAWALFDVLDLLLGLETENADPETSDEHLFWYRLVTLVWFPIQFALTFGLIWFVTRSDLGTAERLTLFFGMGIISGAIGIVYAHELLHQKNRAERWLGDLLLANVLYSHFRSEHLRVHHLWVGTPRDPVSARYNEGFHRYFYRVLRDCPRSAWRAEVAFLARGGHGAFSRRNPFWRYAALQLAMLALALALGGWQGLLLFLWQAFVAVWQLELTNYIEHYGLTRRHLGDGRYEPVGPRHSWNAAHKASNWLLINLQRHSDHHYKPDRRFPLLQNHAGDAAPQLPFGYPLMAAVAMVPPVWRRVMNPKVREWRRKHYPDIADWKPYNRGQNPLPRGT
ncbi:alkane 1-monooxygenase [Cereibacter sp. SYSU M97828]|nr:alkane 1-monooxygenase [Cereibacter flavus]